MAAKERRRFVPKEGGLFLPKYETKHTGRNHLPPIVSGVAPILGRSRGSFVTASPFQFEWDIGFDSSVLRSVVDFGSLPPAYAKLSGYVFRNIDELVTISI